ncbi:hypothetical protein B0H19DRAFT_1061626 [Mycena capillaripes]|nr:hypothetical protein B0H19DRAFT_1061626 [Mycena capillaripes]
MITIQTDEGVNPSDPKFRIPSRNESIDKGGSEMIFPNEALAGGEGESLDVRKKGSGRLAELFNDFELGICIIASDAEGSKGWHYIEMDVKSPTSMVRKSRILKTRVAELMLAKARDVRSGSINGLPEVSGGESNEIARNSQQPGLAVVGKHEVEGQRHATSAEKPILDEGVEAISAPKQIFIAAHNLGSLYAVFFG